MKKIAFVIIIIMGLLSFGCSKSDTLEPSVNSEFNQSDNNILQGITALPAVENLTSEIINGLLFMREEEKVARDVYIALGKKWNMMVFKNISVSEQRHMDALKILIDRYALTDPVGKNAQGVFLNADLQKLYDDLLALGLKSVKDALLVGKLIEEVDIKDLDKELLLVVKGTDIATVYQNLRSGSENHLSAFLRNLQRMP